MNNGKIKENRKQQTDKEIINEQVMNKQEGFITNKKIIIENLK